MDFCLQIKVDDTVKTGQVVAVISEGAGELLYAHLLRCANGALCGHLGGDYTQLQDVASSLCVCVNDVWEAHLYHVPPRQDCH